MGSYDVGIVVRWHRQEADEELVGEDSLRAREKGHFR